MVRQIHRVRLPASASGGLGCTPLLITSTPVGTDTEMSKVALSSGWSLLGNHHQADSGSLTARAPSSVRVQPV